MDAARLRRARWRLRAYFFGSGILMAFIFLILASVVIRLIGLEQTSYITTLVFAAGVMAGGAYGIVLLTGILVYAIKRIITRQPTMEVED